MTYDDDEIARILGDTTDIHDALRDSDPEVIADTVVHVELGSHLGTLDMYVSDRPDLELTMEERHVLFRFPDAAYIDPTEHEKDALTIRVVDLELYISAMQKAITRARSMGALPPATGLRAPDA